MFRKVTFAAVLAVGLPCAALADGDGAVKGGVGGAVAGALVGGPVGAAVGGAAGMAIGGAASGPGRTVVVQPGVAPCGTTTTQTTDNTTGASSTTQTTNCPN